MVDHLEEQEKSTIARHVHIRVQQRNGKKSVTTVQGLDERLDPKRILKALKKRFSCNGTVVNHEQWGLIIQLQGDQRANVSDFLIGEYIVMESELKIHGASQL